MIQFVNFHMCVIFRYILQMNDRSKICWIFFQFWIVCLGLSGTFKAISLLKSSDTHTTVFWECAQKAITLRRVSVQFGVDHPCALQPLRPPTQQAITTRTYRTTPPAVTVADRATARADAPRLAARRVTLATKDRHASAGTV